MRIAGVPKMAIHSQGSAAPAISPLPARPRRSPRPGAPRRSAPQGWSTARAPPPTRSPARLRRPPPPGRPPRSGAPNAPSCRRTETSPENRPGPEPDCRWPDPPGPKPQADLSLRYRTTDTAARRPAHPARATPALRSCGRRRRAARRRAPFPAKRVSPALRAATPRRHRSSRWSNTPPPAGGPRHRTLRRPRSNRCPSWPASTPTTAGGRPL